jgi:hypothetical protein
VVKPWQAIVPMTSVLHEFHELRERRTEIIIHLLNLKHEQKVIDWKQGALIATAFLGLPIALPIAMGLLGGEAFIPIWQSPPKIFWTTVVVGTVAWGVIFFRRLLKEEEANLQSAFRLRTDLEQLEHRIYDMDPSLKKLRAGGRL